MLHLVGCLYYLYQWCTVKQISDNEIYLLIKYIKSVLWWVAKDLSYIEDPRCLEVNYDPLNIWGSFYKNTMLRNFKKCGRPVFHTDLHDILWFIVTWQQNNNIKAPINILLYYVLIPKRLHPLDHYLQLEFLTFTAPLTLQTDLTYPDGCKIYLYLIQSTKTHKN